MLSRRASTRNCERTSALPPRTTSEEVAHPASRAPIARRSIPALAAVLTGVRLAAQTTESGGRTVCPDRYGQGNASRDIPGHNEISCGRRKREGNTRPNANVLERNDQGWWSSAPFWRAKIERSWNTGSEPTRDPDEDLRVGPGSEERAEAELQGKFRDAMNKAIAEMVEKGRPCCRPRMCQLIPAQSIARTRRSPAVGSHGDASRLLWRVLPR